MTRPSHRTFVTAMEQTHGRQLRRFLSARLRRASADVPDLFQEVFLRLLRIKDHEAIRNPQAYLFTVATHLLHQHTLQRRARPESMNPLDVAAVSDEATAADPAEELEIEQQLLPDPGYTYAGSAFKWPTLPEVLQKAGVSWRIYQNPNDNWTGAMHGGLAFDTFRNAKPGSPLYESGMRNWSLEQFAADVKSGTLPQVCWILPPQIWSEHPSPSSPVQGAEFSSRILDALTASPDDPARPALPYVKNSTATVAEHSKRPKSAPPSVPEPLFQERGTRPSRALPCVLDVSSRVADGKVITLTFRNQGKQGAVFHVYDRLHLDRIPRRYTVEAGQSLSDEWQVEAAGRPRYDLWIYAPNGFVRELKGTTCPNAGATGVETACYPAARELQVIVHNTSPRQQALTIKPNAYVARESSTVSIAAGERASHRLDLRSTGGWYDVTVSTTDFEYRLAGRMETGEHSTSDPAV